MFEIKGLHAGIEGKEILRGISLTVKPGEVHAVMGPNGSGKSTLAHVAMGHPSYTVSKGDVFINKQRMTDMAPHKRAQAGLFLSFQYPSELPGVSLPTFMHTALQSVRKNPVSAKDFMKLLQEKTALLGIDQKMTRRHVNEGFSGGEKKRMEILQMALLEPQVAILDETDSGLDIDSLRIVAEGINKLRTGKNCFVLITHYQRILKYVKPDRVHVMKHGKIVLSGGAELVEKLEEKGYDWITDEA